MSEDNPLNKRKSLSSFFLPLVLFSACCLSFWIPPPGLSSDYSEFLPDSLELQPFLLLLPAGCLSLDISVPD